MSAIARFLVEFEPTPMPSSGAILPARSALPPPAEAFENADTLEADHFAVTEDADFAATPFGEGGGFEAPSDDSAFDVPVADLDDADGGSDAALAEAVATAVAAAEAEFAERLAALEEEHALALGQERERWVAEQGAALAEGFGRACADLEGRLAEAVADVLEPLLSEAAKSLALCQLREAIASLTSGGTSTKVAVTGPEDLVMALRTALDGAGSDTSAMTFVPSDEAEVTITADNSVVRTRLADWAASVGHSLGDDA